MAAYDPDPHATVHGLIEHFADLAQQMHASDTLDDSIGRVAATAQGAVGGCEAASVSLLGKDGPYTRGETDELAKEGDRIQYEENEGPCLDAAMNENWVSTPDLGVDPRWPRSAHRIAELGVGSMFSCRLALDAAPEHTLGGLNLYATKRHAFSDQDQDLAILISSLASVVIDSSRQQEQLRAAIASRQVIGEAIGIMRAQTQMSSAEAFAALSKASQRMNVKLRDLAEQIAAGGPPGSTPNGPVAKDVNEPA